MKENGKSKRLTKRSVLEYCHSVMCHSVIHFQGICITDFIFYHLREEHAVMVRPLQKGIVHESAFFWFSSIFFLQVQIFYYASSA